MYRNHIEGFRLATRKENDKSNDNDNKDNVKYSSINNKTLFLWTLDKKQNDHIIRDIRNFSELTNNLVLKLNK